MKNSDEEIPTLKEVFELCKEKIFINIEMKDLKVKETLREVLKMIKDFGMEDQICLSSFIPEYLQEIKSLNIEIEYGFLIENEGHETLKTLTIENYPKLDFIHKGTVNLHFSHCNEENIDIIRKNGLGVHVWFSKNPKHYENENVTEDEASFKKLLEFGVDVICTNYPDKAIKVRQEFMEAKQVKVCC